MIPAWDDPEWIAAELDRLLEASRRRPLRFQERSYRRLLLERALELGMREAAGQSVDV